jgi:hypothetical protein
MIDISVLYCFPLPAWEQLPADLTANSIFYYTDSLPACIARASNIGESAFETKEIAFYRRLNRAA